MVSRKSYPVPFVLAACLLALAILPVSASGQGTSSDTSYVDTVVFQPQSNDTEDYEGVDSVMVAGDDYPDDDSEPDRRLPDSIELRTVPDSTVEKLRRSKEFAYANDPQYWVREEVKPERKGLWQYLFEFFENRSARMILLIILMGTLLYVVYRIVVANNMYVFSRGRKQGVAAEETAFTEIDDDQFDQKIAQAENQGNYRLAIRYQFLRTLKGMNDRGLIAFHPEATNYDYQIQLGTHPISADFAYLTRAYEYCWYGGFTISASQYASVKTRFEGLFKTGSR